MKTSLNLRQTVALTFIPNFGPRRFKKLLEAFGTVKDIFEAPAEELCRVKEIEIKQEMALAIHNGAILEQADKEIKKASSGDVEIIPYEAKNYPEALKSIDDSPIVLYVRGKIPTEDQPKIAVVGSRISSLYGQRIAKVISADLARVGVTIVSGMARGIDTAAHEGALEVNGTTLAVLGSGLSYIYPPENKKLAERILKKGALISEFSMDISPEPKNFPIRNRIISGLSRAVLVAEAREKSGALITADIALEQGRDVFAVPANIDSTKSKGSNSLLKQGAKFVTDAADILEELGFSPSAAAEPDIQNGDTAKSLDGDEKKVWSFLDSEPIAMDELLERASIPANRVMMALSFLEMKKLVKKVPGNYFVKASS